MPTVNFNKTWLGLSNQAPWRKELGSFVDVCNMHLDISVGARSRNGTEFLAVLSALAVISDPREYFFYSYKGDLVAVHSTGIRVWNSLGVEQTVYDTTGGYSYLSGGVKKDFRATASSNSIFILNRLKFSATTNTANYNLAGTVTQYRSLSSDALVGTYYRTELEDGGYQAGYYKRIDRGGGSLDWQLVAAPNQPNGRIDASTLPHQLVRNSDGSYYFGQFDWLDRTSGNDDTNPAFPWFGKAIEDIAFHSNRLFFLADGSITASSSRDARQLFIYDIGAVAEDTSNPISIDIENSSVGGFLYSASIGNSLFIAAKNGQLIFTSGQEQLTNVNGFDILVGSYPTADVPIASSGGSVVLVDGYNNLQEFAYDPNASAVTYSGTMNSHVLRLLHDTDPLSVHRFGSTTYVVTVDDKVRYREFLGNSNQVVQNGWGYFNFNVGDSTDNQVLYMYEWEDSIRIVLSTPSGVRLLKYVHSLAPFQPDFTYDPALDQWKTSTSTYDPNTDRTFFAYSLADSNTSVLISGQPEALTPVAYDNDGVYVSGNYDGLMGIVGQPFRSYVKLGQFYAGASTAKPTISSMSVFFKDTMAFQVSVQRQYAGTSRRYKYKASVVGVNPITDNNIETKSKTFNILSDGRTSFILIENDGISPFNVSALSFEVRMSDTVGAE